MKAMAIMMLFPLIAACAPKLRYEANWEGYEEVSIPHTLTVAADSARVWEAADHVVGEMGMKQVVADSASGMIMCTQRQGPWENTTREMNILLREKSPGETTINIYSFVLATSKQDGNWIRIYPSDGKAEQSVLNRLESRLR